MKLPIADAEPRVPLLTEPDAPLLVKDFFAGGDPGPIVAALAHVPEMLEVALPFIARVLAPSGVDLRTKELVILRASAVAECRYCIDAHSVAALDAGLSDDEVRCLRGESPAEDPFDARERALLAWVDEVAGTHGPVGDDVAAALCCHFPDYEVVELTLLAATTLMLNRLCTALRLPTSADTLLRLADAGLA